MNFRVKICNYIQIYTKVHIIVYNSALADSGALNAPSVVTHIRWIKDEQAFFFGDASLSSVEIFHLSANRCKLLSSKS